MIKCFTFDNFKSFEKAELNLEALTTLIGTNSSGKSNAIEGIAILAKAATGIELNTILDGTIDEDITEEQIKANRINTDIIFLCYVPQFSFLLITTCTHTCEHICTICCTFF